MIIASTVTSETGKVVNSWKTSKDLSWRLIHNGSNILALFQSEGITETKNTIFEGETRDECVAEAQRLGLPGLDEWLAKDTAEQLAMAYKTDKVGRETAFEYAAAIMSQAGVTDVAAAIAATQASRLASGKIILPSGGGVKVNP